MSELWLGGKCHLEVATNGGKYAAVRLFTALGKPHGTVRVYAADVREIAEALGMKVE